MKSTRVSLKLVYTSREEIEKGVWEDVQTEKVVKAEREKVYQRRLDQAKAEGLVINARFKIRQSADNDKELKYATFKGDRYKVASLNESVEDHFLIIELGEMI
jgi:hypothetical protein